MLEWIKPYYEIVAAVIGTFVTTIIGCWMYIRNKVERLNDVERVVFGDPKSETKGVEQRLRELENANISIEEKLKKIPEIAESTKENGRLLAKIAGKLDS